MACINGFMFTSTVIGLCLIMSCQYSAKSKVRSSITQHESATNENANSKARDRVTLNEVAMLPSRGLAGTVRLQFINKQDGWLSNFNHLWRTIDGGRTWTTVYDLSSDRNAGAVSVEFVDSHVGWRSSISSLEKTLDGGLTWTAIGLPFRSSDGNISSVRFLRDGRRGWLTGGLYRLINSSQAERLRAGELNADETRALQGVVFYTEDSGQTWRRQLIETELGQIVEEIVITPTGRAWTIAGHDTFYLLGDKWQKVDYRKCSNNNKLLLQAALNGDEDHDTYKPLIIDFIDDSQGWLSFTDGYIAKTTDGGKTWCDLGTLKTSHSKSDQRLILSFIDSSTGLAVTGEGELYETSDGGSTWNRIETNFTIDDIYSDKKDVWIASNEKLFSIALK